MLLAGGPMDGLVLFGPALHASVALGDTVTVTGTAGAADGAYAPIGPPGPERFRVLRWVREARRKVGG